uniref:J domain-containing protein n=1 Tax=Macrostomum lignano TaxID=282301 RepID=A0A1I8G191_9PLAT
MNAYSLFVSVGLIFALVCCFQVDAQIEGIYCGKENCYDVLGVTRDDDKKTIMSTYRKLARKLHPDRQRTEEDRKKSEETFPRIAQAYEILRDDEQRKEYDYMLDNPEEMYYHFYQYYKRKYSPKVDVRVVIVVIVTAFSIFQYYSQYTNYHDAVNTLSKQPRYRMQAKEIAKSEGLLDSDGPGGKRKRENGRKLTKEEVKEKEEEVIRGIIMRKMDIRGSYEKPSIMNVLWFQLLMLPIRVLQWIYWALRWIVLFGLLKREYGPAEKEYLIRRYMGLSALAWEHLPEQRREQLLAKELWIKAKYVVFAEEEAEKMRQQMAEDTKHKKMRRYLRRGGPGQITFGQEDVDMDFS